MGTAFVDESMRLTCEDPMYLLGATAFEGDPTEGVAELLKQKVLQSCSNRKAQEPPKMHWREMGRKAQAGSLKTVADTNATTTVIIATPHEPPKAGTCETQVHTNPVSHA